MSSGYGRLTVVTGCMMSAKTETLLKWVERARRAKLGVAMFKPDLDDRATLFAIETHSGERSEGIVWPIITNLPDRPRINADVDIIAIDEVQFLPPRYTPGWVEYWLSQGCDVIVAGLDLDWRGEPFETTAALLALADDVIKLTAVCVRCHGEARRTYRTAPGSARVQTGGAESYQALCCACFREARRNE